MLVTEEIIKQEFDKAESNFDYCWALLTDLKEFAFETPDFVTRFILFQEKLALTIFSLQSIRDQIILEDKELVKNKASHDIDSFKEKLRLLSRFKKGIDLVVDIAKALGDAYAYFFYQSDLDLLSEHYSHQRVINHTAGSGERGELEFVKNIKHIDGHFTLFHGITNILRYGDFSFIDLKTLKVVHIGELKTSQLSQQELNLNLSLFSRKNILKAKIPEPFNDSELAKTRPGRQIIGITNFLRQQRSSNAPSSNLYNRSYAQEVDTLTKQTNVAKINASVVSSGVAFTCLKFKPASLFVKVFKRDYNDLVSNASNNITGTAIKLLKKDSKHNSIIIGQLLYNPDFTDKNTPGTVPIFWHEIDKITLKEIYFIDCAIISVFNPIHLINQIEGMGFKVESKYADNSKENEANKKHALQRFDLFISYIMNYLFTESFVIDSVNEILNNRPEKSPAMISMKLQQHVDIFNPTIVSKNKTPL